MATQLPEAAATRFSATGGRSASSRRLKERNEILMEQRAVRRKSLFGNLSKRQTIDQGELSRSTPSLNTKAVDMLDFCAELSASDMRKAKGSICYCCGSETRESGKGLRQCIQCGMIQLASGMTSHIFAVSDIAEMVIHDARKAKQHEDMDAISTRSGSKDSAKRQGSKSSVGAGIPGSGTEEAAIETGLVNPRVSKDAWRRLSRQSHQDMTQAQARPESNLLDEERVPITFGWLDTGYRKGDRVKTTMRLSGAVPTGHGWDPIAVQTDEGTVVGTGHNTGEIMVKFDYNGHICSMKMSQITHVKQTSAPKTNVERSRARKSLPRLGTL